MKIRFFILILFIASHLLTTFPLHSEQANGYRKNGFEVGASAGPFLAFDSFEGTTANGKLDVFAGYRFIPPVSLFADIWTINFVLIGFELNPRFYFFPGPLSPFVTAGVGVSNTNADDSDLPSIAFTYHAGAGLDWQIKKKQVLQFSVKYFGSNTEVFSPRSTGGDFNGAIDIGIGYRWLF